MTRRGKGDGVWDVARAAWPRGSASSSPTVARRLRRRQEGAAVAAAQPDQELPGEQPFPYEKKVRRTRPCVKRSVKSCSRRERNPRLLLLLD